MKTSLLVCTGGRPQAFSLCLFFIERMTRNLACEIELIVVDDCEPPSELETINFPVKIIRPQPFWKEGQNTQRRNLLAGLLECEGDVLVVLEDDDQYRADYLSTMLEKIQEGYHVVGEAGSVYYNIPHRFYQQFENKKHASLCQTVMTKEMIPLFKRALILGGRMNSIYPDLDFWNMLARRPKYKTFLFPKSEMVVGIKGLPGRPGIATGHSQKPREKYWKEDPDLEMLLELIDDDIGFYSEFLEKRDE